MVAGKLRPQPWRHNPYPPPGRVLAGAILMVCGALAGLCVMHCSAPEPVADRPAAHAARTGNAASWRPEPLPVASGKPAVAVSGPAGMDIPYGPHARQRLDLWRPAVPGPVPVVLYFHGGGFRSGDKTGLNPGLREALLQAGLAVAAVNYRLTDTAPFPAPMADGARAVQFLRQQAERYGLDPQHVGATGHSAGAGIALWLALHDDLAEPASDDPVRRQSSRLAAAAVFDGQTTYDPRRLQELFGRTSQPPAALLRLFGLRRASDMDDPRYFPLFEAASPLHHASADDPPVMLLYHQSDRSLSADPRDPRNIHHPLFGRILKARLDTLGVTCRVVTTADLADGQTSLRGVAIAFLAERLSRSVAVSGTPEK